MLVKGDRYEEATRLSPSEPVACKGEKWVSRDPGRAGMRLCPEPLSEWLSFVDGIW